MNTRETEREISVVENTRMRIHWFVERKREKVDLRREWRNGGGDDEIEWNEREYIPFWRKRFFIFIYTKEGKCQIATLISSRTRNRLLSCGVVLVGSFLFVTWWTLVTKRAFDASLFGIWYFHNEFTCSIRGGE
jgi:hypothetical protein